MYLEVDSLIIIDGLLESIGLSQSDPIKWLSP